MTATARRGQIIDATIETIARSGYRQASFARIAEQAGLSSTRLISYHFAGKDELVHALIDRVYAELVGFMGERLGHARTPRERLAAYIRALVEFIATHAAQMQALMSVFLEHQFDDGSATYDGESDRSALGPMQEILRDGQRGGEFRAFDTFVMASAIQRSLDGLPFLLRTAPELDLAAYAEELVTLFDRATRADDGGAA